MPSVHPLRGPELRALRQLQREEASAAYVFVSERKAPLTPHTVRKIVARAGRQAGIEFPIHPHMLRHATGYKLANDGQDTRAILSTPHATRTWRRTGSRISGGIEARITG
jgi:type 1 fimbriae regulatory protein FimB/type 1 fimbriae regulatory protein FimE